MSAKLDCARLASVKQVTLFSSFPQGGREVLCLYGYTRQLPDGLSFPDDVAEPNVARVAEVAVEVMMLRTELDMLVKVSISLNI